MLLPLYSQFTLTTATSHPPLLSLCFWAHIAKSFVWVFFFLSLPGRHHEICIVRNVLSWVYSGTCISMVFLFITAWRTGVLHCLAFVSLRGSCKEKLLFPHIFRNWGQECEWSLLTFVFGVGGGDILIGMSDTRMRIIQLTTLSAKPCLPLLLTWLMTRTCCQCRDCRLW